MDWGWALFYGYAVILSVMVCTVRERGPMRRTIWTLFGVMLAGIAYQLTLGNTWTYSAFMIAVNAIGCRIIVKEPAGTWQGLIGWSFIVQIGVDTGRIGRELYFGAGDMTFVDWVTTAIAFVQLFLVIGWGVHDRISRERGFRLPDPLLPSQAGYAGHS